MLIEQNVKMTSFTFVQNMTTGVKIQKVKAEKEEDRKENSVQ